MQIVYGPGLRAEIKKRPPRHLPRPQRELVSFVPPGTGQAFRANAPQSNEGNRTFVSDCWACSRQARKQLNIFCKNIS